MPEFLSFQRLIYSRKDLRDFAPSTINVLRVFIKPFCVSFISRLPHLSCFQVAIQELNILWCCNYSGWYINILLLLNLLTNQAFLFLFVFPPTENRIILFAKFKTQLFTNIPSMGEVRLLTAFFVVSLIIKIWFVVDVRRNISPL